MPTLHFCRFPVPNARKRKPSLNSKLKNARKEKTTTQSSFKKEKMLFSCLLFFGRRRRLRRLHTPIHQPQLSHL